MKTRAPLERTAEKGFAEIIELQQRLRAAEKELARVRQELRNEADLRGKIERTLIEAEKEIKHLAGELRGKK